MLLFVGFELSFLGYDEVTASFLLPELKQAVGDLHNAVDWQHPQWYTQVLCTGMSGAKS